MNNLYLVSSNRESGHGRYDIQLKPLNKKMPGIIIEVKVLRNDISEDHIEEDWDKAANDALIQIEKKKYITAMKQDGITQFMEIGIAFYKKHIKLISKIKRL